MSELKDKLLKAINEIDFDNMCEYQKDTLQKALVMLLTKWDNCWAINLLCNREKMIDPGWDWIDNNYSIMPGKKTVPFDFSDAEKLIGKVIKSKDNGSIHIIIKLNDDYVYSGSLFETYATIFYNYTYLDGSVIGKEIEV